MMKIVSKIVRILLPILFLGDYALAQDKLSEQDIKDALITVYAIQNTYNKRNFIEDYVKYAEINGEVNKDQLLSMLFYVDSQVMSDNKDKFDGRVIKVKRKFLGLGKSTYDHLTGEAIQAIKKMYAQDKNFSIYELADKVISISEGLFGKKVTETICNKYHSKINAAKMLLYFELHNSKPEIRGIETLMPYFEDNSLSDLVKNFKFAYNVRNNDYAYINLKEFIKTEGLERIVQELGIANNASAEEIVKITGKYILDKVKSPLVPERIENWKFPLETLKLGVGDCDCRAILLASLLKQISKINSEIGELYLVVGELKQQNIINEKNSGIIESIKTGHMWVEIAIDNKIYYFDPHILRPYGYILPKEKAWAYTPILKFNDKTIIQLTAE